jgi:DNA polymerase-1
VQGDPPPVPLVKDKFGSERRKAKVLNFSIAYGKTAHGLMKDFGTDLQEAQETVDRWYADRKEVKEWQERQRDFAKKEGFVTTLLGRRRKLPGIKDGSHMARGHAQRAAINTPIQGAAADVATAAMISIARCQKLKDLRWTLLLQVNSPARPSEPTSHVPLFTTSSVPMNRFCDLDSLVYFIFSLCQCFRFLGAVNVAKNV